MTTITGGSSGTTSYIYNALGQRIEKGTPSNPTLFGYDEYGHLLGEYSSTGALVQETVWLGDLPVATLRPHAGGGVDIYYVHTDHLGTPKMVTRATDNAIIWRWDQEPFGTASPNQNPASQGTFVYNLRFPGQYYDQETGLYYSYFRDYDPTVGRYIESDLLGLKGSGPSTYTYVRGNPVSAVDPRGLVGWHGQSTSYGIAAGIGANFTRYFLTSDCVNGKIASAVVYAVGPSAGIDVEGAPPVTGSYDEVEFSDDLSTPDPSVFNGKYISFNAGVVPMIGWSGHATKLGGATYHSKGPTSYDSDWGYGFELGASLTIGTSTVMKTSISSCGCNSSE